MSQLYFQGTNQRGFGTYPLTGAVLGQAVADAVAVGYRCFDTAQMYENEADVGTALARSGLPRAELCVTTKVHPDNYGAERFIDSVRQSLKALQLDYVDALLLHWPDASGDSREPLRLLEVAQQSGLTRTIGISNFTAAQMRQAKASVAVPLVTNQVEFHPLLDQSVLLGAAAETGIPLSSYCSVARGEVFKHALFAEIGAELDKSAAQVVLRWILQKGVSINTMSTKRDNIAANFNVMDFTLSTVDMARIDALGSTNFRIVTPPLVPWAPEWD
jgi:2,5-diketo-D-gluconate reductase B